MNNKSIVLNILQILDNQVSHYYKSEHNKTREDKVTLLMLTDNNKQQYLFVKRFNALLKNKNDHNTSYFCIDCFKRFRKNLKFERHYEKEDR